MESLANGIPVVLSKDTTPWNIINKKAGYVCSLSNVDEFTSALENIAALIKIRTKNCSQMCGCIIKAYC